MPHQATNAPTHNEPEDATLRRSATKDISFVSFVPRWSGGETAPTIGEFFEIIESSAAISNWSEADRKQICALKLTDAARAFYSATPELSVPPSHSRTSRLNSCRDFVMSELFSIISGSCIWRGSAMEKLHKSFWIAAGYWREKRYRVLLILLCRECTTSRPNKCYCRHLLRA